MKNLEKNRIKLFLFLQQSGDFEVEVSNSYISEQLTRPTGIVDPEIEN